MTPSWWVRIDLGADGSEIQGPFESRTDAEAWRDRYAPPAKVFESVRRPTDAVIGRDSAPGEDAPAAPQPVMRLPFGKFRGTAVEDVPTGYLEWALGKLDLRPDLRREMEAQIALRAGQGVVRKAGR